MSVDPLEGDPDQPLSLHRYLYAHAQPLNNTDPTGLITLSDMGLAKEPSPRASLGLSGGRGSQRAGAAWPLLRCADAQYAVATSLRRTLSLDY